MGDELHGHHQRILHLEQARAQGPASAPGSASPQAANASKDIELLEEKIDHIGRDTRGKIMELFRSQRNFLLRLEGNEDELKNLQRKFAEQSMAGAADQTPPSTTGVTLERVWRIESSIGDIQTKMQACENIVHHMDSRILEVEKKVDTWIPPQIFQTEMARVVAQLEYMARDQDALRHALDANTRWTVKKIDSLHYSRHSQESPQRPCLMPAHHQTPGMGDFSPVPYSAPALVLNGSPDSNLQKKMQKKVG